MSDSIDQKEVPASEPQKQEDFVARKAYEQVTADLHKNKKAKKDLLARVNELEAQREAQEKAKMEEKQQFEELYKKSEAEKAALLQQIEQEKKQLLAQRKKSALKQELGNIKEAYLGLANVDGIELNEDGTINSESVRHIANTFKQEHPALIPSGSSSNITSTAAPIDTNAESNQSVNDLSYDDALKKLMELKNN